MHASSSNSVSPRRAKPATSDGPHHPGCLAMGPPPCLCLAGSRSRLIGSGHANTDRRPTCRARSFPAVKSEGQPGFTFSFFFQIPPFAGNEISAEISPNFAISERWGNLNSKNEISVNSDRNFGDFDRNFGDFDRKMMSVVIFVLFPRSNEKLLNTNFVQFFEIYNFCFRNFFIWAMVWKLFNYFKNYQLKVLSFHVTTSIFSLRSQLDFYYSCYCGYAY